MSPRPSVSSMVVTSKPSIAACSALIGIDLGDDHARAHAAQRVRRALAHVAVAADHRDLAGDHHVGRALDAVGQRFAAAVEVVELRLGHRVVDVDRRNQQLALLPASCRGGARRWWSLRRRRASPSPRSCQRCGFSAWTCFSRSLMTCSSWLPEGRVDPVAAVLRARSLCGSAASRRRRRPRSAAGPCRRDG